MIVEVLELDPRPAYQQRQLPVIAPESEGLKFGLEIIGYEVKYEIRDAHFIVTHVSTRPAAGPA